MSRSTRLWLVLVLNLGLVGALIAVGILARSLGVLAAGADYLADAAAIGVSLVAIWLSSRPPTPSRPNGFLKATTWAAFFNAWSLLVVSMLVILAAVVRLLTGSHVVHGLPVLIASGVAAVAMLGGALILGGDEDDDRDRGGSLNMKAVLLDTLADSAIAGAVAVVGAIILVTGGNYWLDPVVALVMSGVIAFHALLLVLKVLTELKASNPTKI